MRCPAVAELVIDRELDEVAVAPHPVDGIVEPAAPRDRQRRQRARIERGAAIERIGEAAIFVPQHRLRRGAVPAERWRDQRVAAGAEDAPIILVLMIEHDPRGKVAGDRPGQVDGRLQPGAARGIARSGQCHRAGRREQRLAADDVDDPARVHDAVEQRTRPLQHLDALRGGVEAAALHQRHAVVHHRSVAIAAEAALEDGSCVAASVLPWVMPLTLASTSSR